MARPTFKGEVKFPQFALCLQYSSRMMSQTPFSLHTSFEGLNTSTPRTDHDLQVDDLSSSPAVVRGCAGSAQSQIQPRKHVLDRVDYAAPTRQHWARCIFPEVWTSSRGNRLSVQGVNTSLTGKAPQPIPAIGFFYPMYNCSTVYTYIYTPSICFAVL